MKSARNGIRLAAVTREKTAVQQSEDRVGFFRTCRLTCFKRTKCAYTTKTKCQKTADTTPVCRRASVALACELMLAPELSFALVNRLKFVISAPLEQHKDPTNWAPATTSVEC